MSANIVLEGKEYVSAKRAAEETGYARDYIGQLARKGLIGAQRVGGLWYVSLESLKGYQANAEAYVPAVSAAQQPGDPDSIVSFDGKDYISASRASKLSGYNQDYVGQLARAGKILSRQIGNRWYVEKEGLLSHKANKDSLLAAVQREAVGLPAAPQSLPVPRDEAYAPYFNYLQEHGKDLIPSLGNAKDEAEVRIPRISAVPQSLVAPSRNVIDMRAIAPSAPANRIQRTSGKTMRRAIKVGAALTFVIVLSYGLSTLKSSSHYTFDSSRLGSALEQTASAIGSADAIDHLLAGIERLVTTELRYVRGR
jgi:hypothetical protein